MQSLVNGVKIPYILFRDFNEILKFDEEDGAQRCARDIDAFRNCINNCNVVDLGYRGSYFTWYCGNSQSTYIRKRLNRFLVSLGWVDLLLGIDVRHFLIYRSNHTPILLCTENRKREECNEKLFRFESFWLSKEGYREVVSKFWNSNVSSPMHAKLEECGNSLKEWASKEFGEVKRLIKSTERKLANVQKQSPDANMIASELDRLHGVEKAYWHLRSRVNELKDADKNTKYFHRKESSRIK